MLLREFKGAPGEIPLHVCPRLAACGGGTGWGRATSGVGLPPKLPSASTAWGWSRFRLPLSAAVQLEGLAPALPVYSELPASRAHLRTLVRRLCTAVPLRGESDFHVARRARLWRGEIHDVGMASPWSLLRPGLALQPNSGSLRTSPAF